MICATTKTSGWAFGVENPNKPEILSFMRSHEPNGFAEGRAVDRVSGERLPFCDNGYEIGELFYRESDIYNFEKHDMELDDAFCKAVIDLVR